MLRNKIVYFKKIYNFGFGHFFIGIISFLLFKKNVFKCSLRPIEREVNGIEIENKFSNFYLKGIEYRAPSVKYTLFGARRAQQECPREVGRFFLS